MENQDFSQLELFLQSKDSAQKRINAANPFLKYIKAYERTILTIIGFIITGVISFSMGVEKGKALANVKSVSTIDLALNKQAPIELKQQIQAMPVKIEKAPAPQNNATKAPTIQEYIQNYTIQIASYNSESYANKEAEKFKKKGIPATVLSKGKYKVLCVGRFSNKEAAQALLSELKKNKNYAGCYLRRL